MIDWVARVVFSVRRWWVLRVPFDYVTSAETLADLNYDKRGDYLA